MLLLSSATRIVGTAIPQGRYRQAGGCAFPATIGAPAREAGNGFERTACRRGKSGRGRLAAGSWRLEKRVTSVRPFRWQGRHGKRVASEDEYLPLAQFGNHRLTCNVTRYTIDE